LVLVDAQQMVLVAVGGVTGALVPAGTEVAAAAAPAPLPVVLDSEVAVAVAAGLGVVGSLLGQVVVTPPAAGAALARVGQGAGLAALAPARALGAAGSLWAHPRRCPRGALPCPQAPRPPAGHPPRRWAAPPWGPLPRPPPPGPQRFRPPCPPNHHPLALGLPWGASPRRRPPSESAVPQTAF
jgi:hypothetical protein